MQKLGPWRLLAMEVSHCWAIETSICCSSETRSNYMIQEGFIYLLCEYIVNVSAECFLAGNWKNLGQANPWHQQASENRRALEEKQRNRKLKLICQTKTNIGSMKMLPTHAAQAKTKFTSISCPRHFPCSKIFQTKTRLHEMMWSKQLMHAQFAHCGCLVLPRAFESKLKNGAKKRHRKCQEITAF